MSTLRPSVKIITKDLGDHSKDVEQVFISHAGISGRLKRSETVLKLGVNQTTRDSIQEQWCSKAGAVGMVSAW